METPSESHDYFALENALAEMEGLLTLAGEALQQVISEERNQDTAALGVQLLRQGAMQRLRDIAWGEHEELHALRKRVAELEAAAQSPRRRKLAHA